VRLIMEIIDKMVITRQQFEHIKSELEKLEEMEVCLSDYAVACYKLFDVIREKTTIMYWVRIKSSEKGYVIELIKEELSPIDFNSF
jgi:hypothetical protein